MRIALIADTHLSARSPAWVANWHAARRAVGRRGADLTVNLGDIKLDGQTHGDELAFASRLMQQWPTEMRCVPGNHDLGDGSGEMPLDDRLLRACGNIFDPDHWVIKAGDWKLLGINAQLLGSDSAQEAALWAWIANQVGNAADHAHTVLLLHRPMLRPRSGELTRKGRSVSRAATERLLEGPMQSTLRLVVSGHIHQYIDTTVDGVRHLRMPSTAFILPDDIRPGSSDVSLSRSVKKVSSRSSSSTIWISNPSIWPWN